jgi:hypothetical protein
MSDEPKVLLTFQHGDIIVAKRYGFIEGKNERGVMVERDDGSHHVYTVSTNPTNAELYRIKVPADASYEEKRRAIEPVIEELDDRGRDVPDLSTPVQIDQWLASEAEMNESQSDTWGARVNQYAPGFAIMDALTPDERKALGLRESDLGGPAS